mmetsp:Transcript_11854/g.33457  ORF Transcript_11854/g.33457 Transcript_11854/m.33457 type:complete len:408 (+) Transcript_11854:131-1354(+)|eukprot:CAMPEP_0117652328 /NCGR_PEP_ID=MMETSP0804-20121206/2567_1 /TAXON_ID=1074897 /ORGANISM="Tetraselmis astigmatica, Strain CCMP880" /LENGTH=407 /DNA_ID=CAMNT_0005458365 /DNA_START=44 /DNA_END=1267 /DNA_ORIENTATION=-
MSPKKAYGKSRKRAQEAAAGETEEPVEEKQSEEAAAGNAEEIEKPKVKKVKKAKEQLEVTELDECGRIPRDETPRAAPPKGASFKAISWNVNGLRTILNKHQGTLVSLMETEQPDYLCLQEHKLQESDVPAMKEKLEGLFPDYTTHWNVSTVKKGYSGTVVLLKSPKGAAPTKGMPKQKGISSFFTSTSGQGKAKPEPPTKKMPLKPGPRVVAVTFDMAGQSTTHSGEGRLITVEYEKFFLVGAYVPNSGQKLERLDFRTQQWDRDLQAYLLALQDRKPVILTGDLNVAHRDIDIWNVAAKHIPKGAGTTAQERSSFSELLEAGFVDAFRSFHPSAKGCYSYWSVRANGRPDNKGLRLDYFVVSQQLCANVSPGDARIGVHDCWILSDATVGASDHSPVGVLLTGVE